jgi:hypothetical protein
MTAEDHATVKGPLFTFQTAERGYAGDCQVGVAQLRSMFGHNERIYLPPRDGHARMALHIMDGHDM